MNRLYRLVQTIYDNTLRPHLPDRIAVYNGIACYDAKILDFNVVTPNHKNACMSYLRDNVDDADHVVIIGSYGIAATIASRNGSRVTVFEAAAEMVEKTEETLELNKAPTKTVHIVNRAVGPINDAYGTAIAGAIKPEDLPECDVLAIDCEGCEKTVIESMNIRPQALIVECHPEFGISPHKIERWMTSAGYEIQTRWEHTQNDNVTFVGELA